MTGGVEALSDRERETLRLLLAGHDAKSIARDLGLSVHTVNDRLREARRKLGVSSSREAARRLINAEGEHPKFFASKRLGLAMSPESSASRSQSGPVFSRGRSLAWLGGGMLVMSLIVAAAAFLHVIDSMAPPAAGAARGATMAEPQNEADAPGTAAARAWLALVDAGNWAGSWNEAGTLFKAQLSASGWQASIQPVRKPLGVVEARGFRSMTGATTLPGAPIGQYQIVQFNTDFANKHAAVETVVLAREAAGWKVDGYFIR